MSVSIRPALGPVKKIASTLILGILGVVVGYWLNQSLLTEAAPIQPIEFSHVIHAGDNEVPCQYCHIYARRSASAGVPSVNKCVNCHQQMATASAELDKLFTYWQARQPIPWVKVHDLPDFVHFPHKRHIAAGLDCSECHGDVAGMARVRQVAPLQMGWCRDCHEKHAVENGQQCSTCHK